MPSSFIFDCPGRVDHPGSRPKQTNGCTIRVPGVGNLNNPAGGVDTAFGTGDPVNRRPCDNHDLCYDTCGMSKADCDAILCSELVKVCTDAQVLGRDSPQTIQRCFTVAQIVCAVVSGSAGNLAYNIAQRDRCQCCP